MAQKIINVGTVANDGTGDTIRGAFTNVNANFTEVYGNLSNLVTVLSGMDLGQNTTIEASYNVANAAFAQANSANIVAYNVGVSANLFSVSVGAAGNAYSVFVGASSNNWTNTLTSIVGTAGNNYASILSANNAASSNGWSNTLAVTTYAWANSTFTTQSNTAIVYNTTNAAFLRANSALANTTGSLTGNLLVTGTLSSAVGVNDPFGSVRERVTFTINSHSIVTGPHATFIANAPNAICLYIPNDSVFLTPANVGTTIYVYQYGSGDTKIAANDASVTVYSSNNWANIAGQYLTATVVKVLPNTWILTGDLKP